MGGFEKLPSHAAINLDHVARAGFGVLNGIENSIPANVDEFHTVTYATKLDIPTNVQSKDYLRVVVLLLDTSTGRIDNAAEVAYVKTGSLSAIRDLKADSPAPDVEIRNGKWLPTALTEPFRFTPLTVYASLTSRSPTASTSFASQTASRTS